MTIQAQVMCHCCFDLVFNDLMIWHCYRTSSSNVWGYRCCPWTDVQQVLTTLFWKVWGCNEASQLVFKDLRIQILPHDVILKYLVGTDVATWPCSDLMTLSSKGYFVFEISLSANVSQSESERTLLVSAHVTRPQRAQMSNRSWTMRKCFACR